MAETGRWTTSALGLRLHNAEAVVGQQQEVLQRQKTLHGAAAAKSLLRPLRQRNKLGGLRSNGWLTGRTSRRMTQLPMAWPVSTQAVKVSCQPSS